MKRIKFDAATLRRGDAEKKQKAESRRRNLQRRFVGANRFFVLGILFSTLLSFACTPRAFEKPKVAATPVAAEDKQAVFKSELEKMRTADLQYIFVFRRKDGSGFDGEDKKILRASLPFNNRVVLADEDKAVIVGSNYKFPPENLDALRARFDIEDYSTADRIK